MENSAAYEQAVETHNVALRAYDRARINYRAGVIGDAEFIAARQAREAADAAFDVAFDAEVNRKPEGNWSPACGGMETPFKSRSGVTLLYCYNATTGEHAYLNCDTDIILTNEEAAAFMQMV